MLEDPTVPDEDKDQISLIKPFNSYIRRDSDLRGKYQTTISSTLPDMWELNYTTGIYILEAYYYYESTQNLPGNFDTTKT